LRIEGRGKEIMNEVKGKKIKRRNLNRGNVIPNI
jgi:hypothetical protein